MGAMDIPDLTAMYFQKPVQSLLFSFWNFNENSLRAVSSATQIKQNKLQTYHEYKNYADTI